MELLDIPTQRTPTSVPKPKRSTSKARGTGPARQHAETVLPGLSLPELANVSTTVDVATDEHALAHLERCVAEMTFESFEGVVVTDAELRTLKVNNSFTRITGYSKRDAIGCKSTVLSDLHEHLLRERSFNDEVLGRKKSGEIFSAKLRVKAVIDTEDRVTHYIATFNDLSAKKALQKKITHLSFTDSLTGLKNRSALLISLQRAIDKSREQQSYAAVLLLDIDGFKSHNVHLGHLAGDMLLQQSARRLVQALGPNVAIARLFADKFLIVLEELGADVDNAGANAQQLATRVRNCFAEAFDINTTPVRLSVSMGHCLIGMQDISTDVLIDRAELVAYNAKQAGGDCIYSFEFGAMEHAA
ncbi:MAG: sensor domain-containing diguanylate cyclase [Pseudomonadota bacterium]